LVDPGRDRTDDLFSYTRAKAGARAEAVEDSEGAGHRICEFRPQ